MAVVSTVIGDITSRFGKIFGYTYTGPFDADNVLCTALFLLMNPDFVYRRQDELPSIDAVTDGSLIFYDFRTTEESLCIYNRNVNKEYRKTGNRYGTFGLVWRDYGMHFLIPWDETEEAKNVVKFMVDQFDTDIIEPMDVARLNGGENVIQDMINKFNLLPNEGVVYDREDREQYVKAVEFARSFLLRKIEEYRMTTNAMLYMYHSYNSQSSDTPGVFYLDESYTIDTEWALDFIREHMTDVYFMIRPSEVYGYNLFPIKHTKDYIKEKYPSLYKEEYRIGFEIYKHPLPLDWLDKTPEQLNAGWPGLYYCQSDGSRASTINLDQATFICRQIIIAYTNYNKTYATITSEDGFGG